MARVHLDPEGWKKKMRRVRIIAICVALALLLTAAGIWLVKNRIRPARSYAAAEAAEARGDLTQALDGYSLLWDYEDARERAAAIAFGRQPDDSFQSMISRARLGDVVSFGLWEQDGNPDNGPEPIRWIVLADDTGRLLLWSESVLETRPYHDSLRDITWAECSLRRWLNEDFYRTAFTPAEQLLIPLTRVENADNAASGTKGGEETRDHVYILSFNELVAFASYNPYLEQIYAYPTARVLAQGVETHPQWGTVCWWMRTPGIRQNCAAYCDMGGKPLYSGPVNRRGYGIRPLIWVFRP